MFRSLLRMMLLAMLSLGLVAPCLAADAGGPGDETLQAKEKEQEKPKERKPARWGRSKDEEGKDVPIAGPTFLKKFQPALEAYADERYADSVKMLRNIRTRRLSPYETALLHRMIAYALYAQEDLAGAREELQLAVAANGFTLEDQAAAQFTIARLYVADQDWDKVIENLEKWFAMVDEPNSSAYNLLALAYFQKGDYEKAAEPAQKAVDMASAPNEGWLRLLLAVRLTREEFPKAIPVLEDLVRYFPKKTYWLQLSTVHGAIGSYEKALVPLQLAYAQGLLDTDGEIRRLAQLLMFLELPYLAAEILEDGVEKGTVDRTVEGLEMLSNSWIAAREYEKAVEPLEEAARLDPTGNLFVRLAQVHIQREQWSEAATALSSAIRKGGLDKPGDALVLMGIAHYSNKAPATARDWFERARGYADTKKEADIWIQFIDRELAAQGAAGEEQAALDAPQPQRTAGTASGAVL